MGSRANASDPENASATAAPPLPPPLPPRVISGNHLGVSEYSSDEEHPPSNSELPAPGNVARLKSRYSELREAARSFADPSTSSDRKALKRFHAGAMELMDSAAAASSSPPPTAPNSRDPGRYTAMRIRRDKQRLEQQYLAAMSFLDRADADDSELLVEEEPLEGDAASAAADQRQLQNYAREAMSFLEKAFNQDESVLVADEDDVPVPPRRNGTRGRNVRESVDSASIAHDKAELVRYAEEYGEFLDKALDGETIPEDDESQTDASEGDYSHVPGLPTVDSSKTLEDELSEAETDTEFDDSSLSLPPVAPRADSVGRSGMTDPSRSNGGSSRIASSARNDDGSFRGRARSDSQERAFNESRASDVARETRKMSNLPNSKGLRGKLPSISGRRPERPASPKVSIVLTGSAGESGNAEQVTLERTFFRKLPRGSTVQIRPLASKNGLRGSEAERSKDVSSSAVSEELGRIKSERDALIGVLEEIVNERSMLAVQVGEVKQLIRDQIGQPPSRESDDVDLNLGDELYSAYETMRVMTEETEDTLNNLEAKLAKVSAHNGELAAEKADLEFHVEDLKVEVNDLQAELSKEIEDRSSIIAAAKRELYGKQSDALAVESELAEMRLEFEKEKSRFENELALQSEETSRLKKELDRRSKEKSRLESELDRRAGDISKLEDEVSRQSDENEVLKKELAVLSKKTQMLEESVSSKETQLRSVQDENETYVADLRRKVQQANRSSVDSEQDASLAREELGKLKVMLSESRNRATDLEEETNELRRRLERVSASNDASADELKSLKVKYDESVKARAASAAQNLETVELQRRLADLQRESHAREDLLRKQMHELKEHANRAVAAATLAEQNAGQAATTASTAQANAQAQIEAERANRVAAELKLEEKKRELAAKESERYEWEKYAREKAEIEAGLAAKSSSRRAISNLVPSGSRRGVNRRQQGGSQATDQDSFSTLSLNRKQGNGTQDRDDRAQVSARHGRNVSTSSGAQEKNTRKNDRRRRLFN